VRMLHKLTPEMPIDLIIKAITEYPEDTEFFKEALKCLQGMRNHPELNQFLLECLCDEKFLGVRYERLGFKLRVEL
jgi:hypothetical protein